MSSKELIEMTKEEKLELVVELVEAVKENLKEGEKLSIIDASFLDLALDLLEDIVEHTDMV